MAINLCAPEIATISWSYNFKTESLPQIKLRKADYRKGITVRPFVFGKEHVEIAFQEYIKSGKKEDLEKEEHVRFLVYCVLGVHC
jgi:hypothetical protein